jgi:DNA end-binding protein Ku
MVYADEVNAADEISELQSVDAIEVNDKELAMAEQLIESLSAEFDASKFADTYRNRVLGLIEAKASGATEIISAPEPVAADKVVDLMAALEASVAAAKETRKRHPTGRPVAKSADGAVAEKAKPKKAAAPRKRKSA